MQCRRCEHENSSKAKFCEACGTPLSRLHETGSPRGSYDDQERALGEALAQQTATAEILHVISRSPTDIQPVLDAVAESATRLCVAYDAIILRLDGDILRRVAHHGRIPSDPGLVMSATSRDTVTGRAVLDRQPIHVADLQAEAEEFPDGSKFARRNGHRTILSVPLLREGIAIGVITIRRTEVQPFTDSQIVLLQTFAHQAVIAIENVRLFTELQTKNADLTDALEQQTATAEILRVISTSPTDLQPVLDAVVRSAGRFCGADDAEIYHLDGHSLKAAAHHGPIPAPMGRLIPVVQGTVAGRAVLGRRPVHVADLKAEAKEFPVGSALAREFGYRTGLAVPLLREGTAVGTINLRRTKADPFTDKQIALLQTFADQAVIAIENVRLFKELQEKNRALTDAHAQVTESLEQQTATSDILRVISSSPTDVQPVFDTIVRSAVRLCAGLFSALYQFDGELLHRVAQHNYTPEALGESDRVFPTRPTRGLGAGRAIIERAVVHMPDVELDPEHQHKALSRVIGNRSSLWVPMLREGAPIGVITVARAEAGPFSNNEIELLKTFADQAVIAVENVRLFKELQARTGELTQSVEQLTALGEVSRAVSSTLDVETVLDTIVSRASQLAGAAGCSIYVYDEGACLLDTSPSPRDA
jgi:two-component system NtrC family sensor kinase